MNWKNVKRFGTIIILLVLLYTSYNAISEFFIGYHNIDLAYNYKGSVDMTTTGQIFNMETIYIKGLNQIKNGFMWICFDVLLGVLLGYLIKNGEEKN